MQYPMFERFRSTISSLSPDDLQGGDGLLDRLEIARSGAVRACYTPFEFVNEQARVVLVGLTPGRQQLANAVAECRRQILAGADPEEALRSSKAVGAFSGPIRANLVALLDGIRVHEYLGLESCASLFGRDANLVHTTSVLRNAVFVGSANYSGSPGILKSDFLRARLIEEFGADDRMLSKAVYVPLGDDATEAVKYLVGSGYIRGAQVLDGLPHPSGANAERIAYFLDKKDRSSLSAKTSASKLDDARQRVLAKVAAL